MGTCFKVENLRKKAGFTQQELAEKLGFQSASIISMWESGSRNPRSEILPVLAGILGCTVNDLYGSDAENETEQKR